MQHELQEKCASEIIDLEENTQNALQDSKYHGNRGRGMSKGNDVKAEDIATAENFKQIL